MKETQDVENSLIRHIDEVYLNMPHASIKIKRQYQKALQHLSKAQLEFSILNDMKDEDT